MLPLVCKHWARTLGQPSAAWAHADIDLQTLHKRKRFTDGDSPLLDEKVVSAWFCRCLDECRRMDVQVPGSLYAKQPLAMLAMQLTA